MAEFVEMNTDRNVQINIPKEVTFTLSHFTSVEMFNFNVNFDARLYVNLKKATELTLLWMQIVCRLYGLFI